MNANAFTSRLPIVREEDGTFYRAVDVSGCTGDETWRPFEAKISWLRQASATMSLRGQHGQKLGEHAAYRDYSHLLHGVIDSLKNAHQACLDYAVGPDTPLRIDIVAKVVDRPVVIDQTRMMATVPATGPTYIPLDPLLWVKASAEELAAWDKALFERANDANDTALPSLNRIEELVVIEQVIWDSRDGISLDDHFSAVMNFLSASLTGVPEDHARVAIAAIQKVFAKDKRLTA